MNPSNHIKIAKITQDGYNNYGNTLQRYALQEYLLGYADTVDSIWHTPNRTLEKYWKWRKKDYIKFAINYKGFRDKISKGHYAWDYVRRARFYDFNQKYINNVYPTGSLEDTVNNYDYFVTGSDQVWNPTYKKLDDGFLTFCPPQKRIAYAASIGAAKIPEDQIEYYKNNLRDMHAISVREDSAGDIIKDLTGKTCQTVLDPCLCISADKWADMAETPYWIPDKEYMFSYFLGPTPPEIDNIAAKYGLENIKVYDKNNFYHATISPQEWLALISNAKVIYTDSFHCSVFSMIFRKPFVICDRIGSENIQQMRTRFDTLFSRFGYSDRFVDSDTNYMVKDPFYVDYSDFQTNLEKEKQISDNYLNSIFK
ncbi:MAG: polysaccharide pyruvyl transferase family protein [Butyrivibrio sp.]|nr:polysaccharide pyruvyl transferase family protein [Butyrivibrio sp.]